MSSLATKQKNTSKGIDYFVDQMPKPTDFLEEVVAGLSKCQKAIPPKFFYDAIGSHLFDKICETPEYYVTRTEIALLNKIGGEISEVAGASKIVVEFGCGSSLKIGALLTALEEPAEYLAIDISREHLLRTATDIANDFPQIRVGALCADFSVSLQLPEQVGGEGKGRLAFFPGSTIGNQTPKDAKNFLYQVRGMVGAAGALLIGVDLKKDKSIIDAAYNDAAGYTAAFNLNLLHRMKNELGAEVEIDAFRHRAFYNTQQGRVEMHLVSSKDQVILVNGMEFEFSMKDTIHTENSYKYTLEEFADLAIGSGFKVLKVWKDAKDLFSVQYLEAI